MKSVKIQEVLVIVLLVLNAQSSGFNIVFILIIPIDSAIYIIIQLKFKIVSIRPN